MQRNFVKHLEHIQRQASSVPSDDEKNTNSNVESAAQSLKHAREVIAEANKSHSCDLQYMLDGLSLSEVPLPYDATVIAKCAEECQEMLKAGCIITFNIDTGKFTTSEIPTKKIKDIAKKLFNLALKEILNDLCEVKPEILEILGLNQLHSEWLKHTEHETSQVSLQLISAYFKQILLDALKYTWQRDHREDYQQISNTTVNPVHMFKYIDILFQERLSKEKETKLRSYPIFNRSLVDCCAELLIQMPEDLIKKIVLQDLRSDIPIPETLKAEWQKGRVDFWEGISEKITETIDSHFVASAAINAAIATYKKPAPAQSTLSFKSLFTGKTAQPVVVRMEYPLYQAPMLYKYILVRDNLIVLNNIPVQFEKKCKPGSKEFNLDKDVLAHIQRSKTNVVCLTWESKYLLPLFIAHCTPSGLLKQMLDNYHQQFLLQLKTLDEMKTVSQPVIPPTAQAVSTTNGKVQANNQHRVV